MLPTVSTIRDLRAALLPWREAGETVALIPTMGALHKGHIALVDAGRRIAARTVTSIFVNPLQFGPKEDLARYPRPLEADQKLLADAGCDLLFAPTAAEMYPEGFSSLIDPGPMGGLLEGAHRPGHFNGVVTVVAKLLLQTLPDIAIFGEKDYQQLLLIRRTAQDLNIPVHIAWHPIVRDDDGLAFSSRNIYLSAEERGQATALPQALQIAAKKIRSGQPVEQALAEGRESLLKAGFVVDYFVLADAGDLAPAQDLSAPRRLLAATRMGTTRLIDNMAV